MEPPRLDPFPAVTRICRAKKPWRATEEPVAPRKQKEADSPSRQGMLAQLPLPRAQAGRAAALTLWGVFAGEADPVPGLGQHAADECPDAGKGALHHARPEWQPSQALHHGEW